MNSNLVKDRSEEDEEKNADNIIESRIDKDFESLEEAQEAHNLKVLKI